MTERHPSTPTPPPAYAGLPQPQVVYYLEEPINWRAYWRVLVEDKKRIAVITAVSTLLALLAAFLIPPTYRAEVLLGPVSQEKTGSLSALAGQFGDLAVLGGINLADKKDKTAQNIAALKSRVLATEFITQDDLKPELFPGKWDAEKKKWKDPGDVPTDWEAFYIFDKDIRSVSVDRRSGLVTLSIEWNNPVRAAAWANSLVRHVNNRLRNDAIQETDKSIHYLEKQLAQTSTVEVQQAIYRLIESETKNKMIASTREEYAFTIIDPAVVPEERAGPKRLFIVLVGLIIGVATGFIVAWFRRTE